MTNDEHKELLKDFLSNLMPGDLFKFNGADSPIYLCTDQSVSSILPNDEAFWVEDSIMLPVDEDGINVSNISRCHTVLFDNDDFPVIIGSISDREYSTVESLAILSDKIKDAEEYLRIAIDNRTLEMKEDKENGIDIYSEHYSSFSNQMAEEYQQVANSLRSTYSNLIDNSNINLKELFAQIKKMDDDWYAENRGVDMDSDAPVYGFITNGNLKR